MKTLTRKSKNHLLRIFCSLSLLFAMIPGVLAQEPLPDESPDIINKEDVSKANAVFDKSTTYRLNVAGSDALIHGLTVGRGSGSGGSNTALGVIALNSNTSSTANTAIGFHALTLNTAGSMNTAIGSIALRSNTTGSSNTAVGRAGMHYNTTGNQNTASGEFALHSNTIGHRNTATGYAALYYNTTGSSNVAIGMRALLRNTDRSNLVAVGDSALFNNGLNATMPGHAIRNTALGSKALYANTTGSYNTATGWRTLFFNTTGGWNTATGEQALFSNTTGFGNTATGIQALVSNTTGYYNTAYGIGALRDLTAGSQNVGFGDYVGYEIASINRGTFIGGMSRPSITGLTNVTGIGFSALPTASNQVRIGNSSVTSIGGQVTWSALSDGGYKNNVEEDVAGLDFILKLRPVSYNLDAHRLASDFGEDVTRAEDGSKATALPDEITQKSRDEKAAIRYTGFIAQEVEATINELGVTFSGVDAPVNKSGHYGLRYSDFVVPLVKAVQEQQAQIEALSPEGIDALREELSELRQANEQLLAAEVSLRAENENIRGQIKDILSMLETLGGDMQDCCQQQTTGRNSSTSSLNQLPDNARLEQNAPNPFHENTLIRYFLPEGTHRAQIIVTDMAGIQVMTFPLEHQGAGQVMIHGGTLPSGTYVFTLTMDGRKVDSKRMVLL